MNVKRQKKLLMKLQEAEEAVKDESAWMSLDELKKSVGIQLMMKLRINPIVSEDLKKMKEYIAEDNEEMAVKTIREIYARFENIQQFSDMGADLAKRVSFRTDYKYVICGNYVVLYKVGKEYVEIYRVVNRYQDITKIF